MKKKLMAVLLLFGTLISMFFSVGVREAEAAPTNLLVSENMTIVFGDDNTNLYKISVENDVLKIKVEYHHNSKATLSYHTEYLYFTTYDTGGNPFNDPSCKTVDVPTVRGTEIEGNVQYETFSVSADTLRGIAVQLFGADQVNSEEGVTMYISQGFVLKRRTSSAAEWKYDKAPVYSTSESIQNAGEGKWAWSLDTYNNFPAYFDVPLQLKLTKEKYTLTVDTTEGGIPYGDSGEIEVGTVVTVGASANTGYKFVEWRGNTSGLDVTDWSESEISFTMPERDVHLTGVFEKVEGVTPIPTHAPVSVTPIPTEPPDPTATPTPLPTPTPSYPTEDKIGYVQNYRYYTTDKGYSIETLSASAELVDRNGATDKAYKLLQKDASYSVGTDTAGNTWYFAPEGTNATFVHPKVYNGNSVASSDIKYIQELTFPEKLTCDGTIYIVTSIGGGLSWYGDADYSDVSYNDSGVGGGTSYSRGKITGNYRYHWTYVMNASFHNTISEYMSYCFGVIGNGSITSAGGPSKYWPTTGAQWYTNYGSTYEVYNTTLAEITIPDTVTRVEAYAFANCNALVKINGGDKLKEIGNSAFAAESEELALSYTGENDSYCYYYYNESYTLEKPWTKVMQEYDKTRQLSEYMQLADFSNLKTIESYAFKSRKNLYDVVLPEGLATIQSNAFYDCRLNTIEIPSMTTAINGSEESLGTKGYGTDTSKTCIITVPESKAMYYGLENIRYYKLRCGYDVTYENNFSPEESYASTSELKEWFVNEKESIYALGSSGNELIRTQISGNKYDTSKSRYFGTITLDTEGNVWFRHNGNLIPEQVDFGCKAVDIFSSVGKRYTQQYTIYDSSGSGYSTTEYVASAISMAYVVLENGEVYYFNGSYIDASDTDTPRKSKWVNVGVPVGASKHLVVRNTRSKQESESYSNASGGGGYTSYHTLAEIKLFYITGTGELEYILLGSTSSMDGGGGNYNGTDFTNQALPYTYLTTEVSSERHRIPEISDTLKVKNIYILPESIGSISTSENSSSGDAWSSTSETYAATLKIPTIYATASNGTLWKASAVVSSKQEYSSYSSEYKSTVTGEPIVEITISDDAYTWEGCNIKQTWPSYTGGYNNMGQYVSTLCPFSITDTGSLLYTGRLVYNGSASNVTNKNILSGNFVSRENINGVSFLTDEDGAVWFYNDSPYVTPKKLFDDASVVRVYAYQGNEWSSSTDTGGYYSTSTNYEIIDSKHRLWTVIFTTETTSSSIGGSYSTSTSYRLTEPTLYFTFPSAVKKKETERVRNNFDFHNNSINDAYSWSTMWLLEDGSIYADGSVWAYHKYVSYVYDGMLCYAPSGYSYINGTGNTSNGPVKVSGDIKFIDVQHHYTYSLAMDEYGNIYRSGRYQNNKTGEYDPEGFDGFQLTEDYPMTYEDDGSFLAGYHFVETLYDNMFTRDNFTFLSWNEETDGSGAKLYAGEDLVLEGEVTLYAQWEKTANKVRYHPNGGGGTMEDTVCEPTVKNITLRRNTYIKKGYEFVGWNTKKDGTGIAYRDGATFVVRTGTTVLYAQWKPFDYTVKVAEDDSRVTPVTITDTFELAYDEEFTVPDALPDKAYTVGYDLNKRSTMSTTPYWKTSLPLSNEYTKASLAFLGWMLYEERVIDNDYRYLNKFLQPGEKTKNLAENKAYTPVLFPYWGGDAAYVKLPTAACEGYWFIGWTLHKNETDEEQVIHAEEGSGAQYRPTGNQTLYGYYEPREYDIALIAAPRDAELGEIIQEQTEVTMVFDELIPNVIVPESERHVFLGYFDKLDAEGRPTLDSVQYYDENGNGLVTWRIYNESVTELYAYMISEVEVTLDGRGATKQEQTAVIMTYDKVGPDVTPPEKTGYTFKGYYTEIRGGGTQYFDASGKGTNIWREKDVDILYAYWEQNPVELPEKDVADIPEVLPEEHIEIEASFDRSIVHLYADDNDTSTGAETDLQPYLVSDVVISGVTEAMGAIPSTENIAIRAKMGAWMLSGILERRSGIDYIRVHVTIPYRTQYENVEDEDLVISDVQTKTIDFMIPKAWSYWIVEDGGIYFPEKVVVQNDSIDGECVEVPVRWNTSGAIKKPSYQLTAYGGADNHISFASYDADGTPSLSITVTDEQYIISDTPGTLPDVMEHLTIIGSNAAWRDNTQLTVKSDCFSVAGVTLLSDIAMDDGNGAIPNGSAIAGIKEKITETAYTQAYESSVPLLVNAANGKYETTAEVVYEADDSNEGSVTEKRVAVTDTNEVIVHTPVVCDGILTVEDEDSDRYNDTYPVDENKKTALLVLDDTFKYFTITVENTGLHRMSLGYGEKDFLQALSGRYNVATSDSGALMNQVKFPFDVYFDKWSDSYNAASGVITTTEDMYIPANTWVTIGDSVAGFYVPATQPTGEYTVEFRTIAANCPRDTEGNYIVSARQEKANVKPDKYVATDSLTITIKGGIANILLTGTNDATAMKGYSAGGDILTLSKGYYYNYMVKTAGDDLIADDTRIDILPNYYYITADGEHRVAANVYYHETINGKSSKFVKVGSERDMENMHSYSNRNKVLQIPEELLSLTAKVLKESTFAGKTIDMFTFNEICLNRYVRMYPGVDKSIIPESYCTACNRAYLSGEEKGCGHSVVYNKTSSLEGADTALQDWYGIFYLPADSFIVAEDTMEGYCQSCKRNRYVTEGATVCPEHGTALTKLKAFDFEAYAAKSTFTGSEEFFQKDGYLAVNFAVNVSNGATLGSPYIEWNETEIAKRWKTSEIPYSDGDMVLYRLDRSIRDDYEVGGSE